MNLRPFDFSKRDYRAVADIWNRTYPEHLAAPEEVERNDDTRPEKNIWQRYVLELSGDPIGFGVFLNSEDTFHPQEFVVMPVVVPEQQGKGYGKALFSHLMEQLEPHRPRLLQSWSREDFERKTRFLQDRGFEEAMRSFESRLDVRAFDFSPYCGLTKKLEAQGIVIRSFAELADDPERERKIYALHTTLDQDVPMVGEYTKPKFDTFAAHHWGDGRFVPEAYILALEGDNYIGMSELFRSPADDKFRTGLTGVLRDYRRKGVALAVKLRSIARAKAAGVPEITTWNASNNRPMLAINERLGFVKQPATVNFVKWL